MMRRRAILIVVILLFISAGCVVGFGGTSVETTETVLDDSFETCELRAIELIPETFELRNDGGKAWVYWGEQQWKDGTLIEYFGVSYKRGERTGQNIDYYYMDETSQSFSYSNMITSFGGTSLILGLFSMRPVLKSIEETKESYKGEYLTYSTQNFVIVEPNIFECAGLKDLNP